MKRVISSVDTQNDATGKKVKSDTDSENDYELIWNELKCIVKNLVFVCPYVNEKEINDVLLVASQDPDRMTFFTDDYGYIKVKTAIEAATKLLYPNGAADIHLSDYLWWKLDKLVNTMNVSYVDGKPNGCDWTAIYKIANNLFNDYVFHIPVERRKSLEIKRQRHEFNVLMAVDPKRLHGKIASFDIGHSKVEIGISVCSHILESMLKRSNETLTSFRNSRNRKIWTYWERYLKNITPNTTLSQVRRIVKEHWKHETDDQIDAFSILLNMESGISNSKFLLFTEAIDFSKESMDDIEKKVKRLQICHPRADEYMETKGSNIVDRKTEISMPIVAAVRAEDRICKFQIKLKKYLRKKLSDAPDSEIWIHSNGYIVCANLLTLAFVTTALKEFPFKVSINSIQLAGHEFRRVIMLSSARINEPFDVYMKKIKRIYPHLRTTLWKCMTSISDWKLNVEIDVHSIAYLEQHKRRLLVGELVLKFNIRYVEVNDE